MPYQRLSKQNKIDEVKKNWDRLSAIDQCHTEELIFLDILYLKT